MTLSALTRAINAGPRTAAGPDGVYPGDLRCLNETAKKWLVALLNMVEEGEPWPRGVREARAVTLAKTSPPSAEDPFQYRLLLMLPALYRLWARMRLYDMEAWIETWGLPEMFAGVPRKWC